MTHTPLARRTLGSVVLTAVALLLVACNCKSSQATDSPYEDSIMKPSVTYLHLLAHTPFFTELDKPQLRWVIDHSREWQARSGTVIAQNVSGQAPSDDIWILLDGGWQIEAQGQIHPAGHADPGKWYSAADVGHASRLVMTESSYVMRIKRDDMNNMLAQGFAFQAHLEAGKTWYRGMFQ